MAGKARHGLVLYGEVELGEIGYGRQVRLVEVLLGTVRRVGLWRGLLRHGRQGVVRQVLVGSGRVRFGKVRSGESGQVR